MLAQLASFFFIAYVKVIKILLIKMSMVLIPCTQKPEKSLSCFKLFLVLEFV